MPEFLTPETRLRSSAITSGDPLAADQKTRLFLATTKTLSVWVINVAVCDQMRITGIVPAPAEPHRVDRLPGCSLPGAVSDSEWAGLPDGTGFT